MEVAAWGSSPRGRGKRAQVGGAARAHRLIPARAGKTPSAQADGSVLSAHPRAGGENALSSAYARSSSGSSPRGRGKLRERDRLLPVDGLIPARAGKTVTRARCCVTGPAHPRAGGENTPHSELRAVGCGSSPRGRGKRALGSRPPHSERLIPARAGKTPPGQHTAARSRAHPRAGGENLSEVWSPGAVTGSSPRGRGKRIVPDVGDDRPRLIPARAGKTHALIIGRSSRPAHPRAGGENGDGHDVAAGPEGSSPRGRGKRARVLARAAMGGLIPARAGKTLPKRATRTWLPAHPRAGGENPRSHIEQSGTVGSSPRGRGKPAR